MIIDRGSRIGMYNKRRDHVRDIEPLGTPVPNRINHIIINKRYFSFPDRIGWHNHPAEKYYYSKGAASNKKIAK
jgi:hypothetical protein